LEKTAVALGPTPARSGGGGPARKLTLLPLVAATYFMVAGGPYGLEELVRAAGYAVAVVILAVTPLLWSLPTALMVSELSSALPEEGGYYAWVRRAMGPFWGFQEAWLSLAASVFDMAIYPTLFVGYFHRLVHVLGLLGPNDAIPVPWQWALGAAVIAACVVANLRGARAVGGSSVLSTLVVLGPFAVLTAVCFARPAAPAEPPPALGGTALLAGIFAAMWNYMGWDNASTVAGEVERPQRTYPLAMIAAVLLVAVTYILPVLAASRTGIPSGEWKERYWVEVGEAAAGPWLGAAVAIGGMFSALAMFNALVLSYSRVPVALAEDGLLPPVLTRRGRRTGVPWVSVLACAAAWALALGLPLKRLFALDVTLYGLSLLLEFVALVVLRIREPGLPRPFRVPGGKIAAGLLGLGPALLIGAAVVSEACDWTPDEGESIAPAYAVLVGAAVAALGPAVYFLARRLWHTQRPPGLDPRITSLPRPGQAP
jgi:amino acid transporter